MYHNYNAAVWGFISGLNSFSESIFILLTFNSISGLISFCVFHLNYLYLKNKIEEWYNPESLENLKLLGLIVFLSSIVSFGVYLSLVITRNQGLHNLIVD
jgi:amino acid transporter